MSAALILLLTYSVSVDCPNVINLAKGLGIQVVQPTIWTSLQSDCCSAVSVTCVGSFVTKIDWRNLGLNGTINGTAIPSGVTNLWLHLNRLSGSFPMNLPDGLLSLDVSGNFLTGGLSPSLPSRLQVLYVDKNLLSGDLPNFPSTIQYIHLGIQGSPINHFTGTLRLSRPTEFFINNNWITDIFIQDTSALVGCRIDNTPLLGNPNIVNLTLCTQTGLYSASQLPKTITTRSNTIYNMKTMIKTNLMESSTTTADTSIYNIIKSTIAVTTIDQKNTVVADSMDNSVLLTTAILETFQFQSLSSNFTVNLKEFLKLFIDLIILAANMLKTPFLRELKKFWHKQMQKGKQNDLGSSSLGAFK